MKSFIFFFMLIFNFIDCQQRFGTCGEDGIIYALVDEVRNFNDQRNNAEGSGCTLAVPRNQNQFDRMKEVPELDSSAKFIGLKSLANTADFQDTGSFKTLSGESNAFTSQVAGIQPWASEQPHDSVTEDRCLLFLGEGLFDVLCTDRAKAICEFSCTPPTQFPSVSPTQSPSAFPTQFPSVSPTQFPTLFPTQFPSVSPTQFPSAFPTQFPSVSPTQFPTLFPTQFPSVSPTQFPSGFPTQFPSVSPTQFPTVFPTALPSVSPTQFPTLFPTQFPSVSPSEIPSASPSEFPSASPTEFPSVSPTEFPSFFPTEIPSAAPSRNPTVSPSLNPSPSAITPFPSTSAALSKDSECRKKFLMGSRVPIRFL